MREQRGMDATTFKRRASLPPEGRIASRHHVRTRTRLYPEEVPYLTEQRRSYPANFSYPDDDPDYAEERRPPTSTLRWRDTQGNQVIEHGNQRIVIHDAPPPVARRPHWLVIFGIGMIATLLLWLCLIWVSDWWMQHQLDATYGFPRTYQTDAVVYPGDSAAHPSHYIFLNLGGTVIIIELPHGDPAHARDYRGPTLFSDHADLIPVTGDFRQVNGKEEMLVHIQDETLIYVNDGTQFQPQR